jgi:oligopeptide/dipeptide ABC transporter ATP-binding protein
VADPDAKKERIVLQGELPSPFDPPSGCPFHPRCAFAVDKCRANSPVLTNKQGRDVACWVID